MIKDPKPVPQWWRNKINKKKYLVTPWWELPEDDVILDLPRCDATKGHNVKFGQITSLVQIGWLMRNEHNVFFGLNRTCEEGFDFVKYHKPKK